VKFIIHQRQRSLMFLSALSIIIQVEASTGVVFFDISIELAYLCVQVGLTVIYTLLVANRLLTMRGQLRQVMREYDSSTYDTIVLMVVESALAYTVFAIVFIIAFAMHNNGLTTMCFLSIGKVQVSRQNWVFGVSDTRFFFFYRTRALLNCSSSFVLQEDGQFQTIGRPKLLRYLLL
jgi:hypothetical protein